MKEAYKPKFMPQPVKCSRNVMGHDKRFIKIPETQ